MMPRQILHSRWIPRSFLLVVGVLICSCFLASHALGAWLVEGRVSLVLDPEAPQAKASYILPFRVESDGCRWTIGIQNSRISPHLKEINYGFDGKSLYYLEELNQAFARTNTLLETTKNAVISDRAFPPFDFNHFIHLWFAYASRCVIASSNLVPCALALPADNLNCQLKADIEFAESGSFVTKARVFQEDTNFAGNSASPMVILEYEVLESANASGQFAPQKFIYRAYHPGSNGSRKCAWSLHGEASKTTWETGELTGRPAARGLFRVTDYRIPSTQNAGYTVYFSTNTWYEVDSDYLTRIRATGTVHPQVSRVPKSRVQIVMAIFAASLLAGTALLLITRKTIKKGTTS